MRWRIGLGEDRILGGSQVESVRAVASSPVMGDREHLSRAAKGKAFDHASGSFLGPAAAAALAAAEANPVSL